MLTLAADVVEVVEAGQRAWAVQAGDLLEFGAALPDGSADLVIGSPPYPEKGRRYEGARRRWKTDEWVEWMLAVTEQYVRVSRGFVFWVVNGSVKDGRYLPACEGLAWEWHKLGGWSDRSVIWHKNAPPNRLDYFSNDWEFVLAFKKPRSRPPFDWRAIASPPKYTTGGRFRQRDGSGRRRLGGEYPKNDLARPRDVLRVTVGGGHMGSKLAHDSEAPFPEKLVDPFILSCCPPGGLVIDPFAGSGTTLAAAVRLGRRAIGCDVRESQAELTRRRLNGGDS